MGFISPKIPTIFINEFIDTIIIIYQKLTFGRNETPN